MSTGSPRSCRRIISASWGICLDDGRVVSRRIKLKIKTTYAPPPVCVCTFLCSMSIAFCSGMPACRIVAFGLSNARPSNEIACSATGMPDYTVQYHHRQPSCTRPPIPPHAPRPPEAPSRSPAPYSGRSRRRTTARAPSRTSAPSRGGIRSMVVGSKRKSVGS